MTVDIDFNVELSKERQRSLFSNLAITVSPGKCKSPHCDRQRRLMGKPALSPLKYLDGFIREMLVQNFQR